ncbi:copper chaperone PCu(A)C [Jeongeupia chitinilytica]|uniref:Copper chaperone PCu(A)C n=1 Tax=Jeongeupia chitinilytica TaxID=1041641 RepID=A0ABQ3H7W8_9NEIS|nr:copper chaperone PCu(A)C [Jeongeupia chitinilytica]GHD68906.1 hypothetical protein GCM10007350_34820 [Jeongeupia chitinilytica]
MISLRTFCCGLVLAALSLTANAHEYKAGDLFIHHPWTRATPPGAQNAGVFLLVKNNGDTADQLIGVETDAADKAELHQMKLDNGVMKMNAVTAVDIPAKAETELKPGGYHVMLFKLAVPLKEGDKFPLTLKFKRAGNVKVDIKVEAMGAKAETMHQH